MVGGGKQTVEDNIEISLEDIDLGFGHGNAIRPVIDDGYMIMPSMLSPAPRDPPRCDGLSVR